MTSLADYSGGGDPAIRASGKVLDKFSKNDELPLRRCLERELFSTDQMTGRIERLAELGHELRRPEADFLRDGIYELRAKHGGVNYRMLYFFHGRVAAVVSHGFAKQRAEVPVREIKLAIKRKERFEAAPKACTYEG